MVESPHERLLKTARTPEDAVVVAKFDERMALPLILAAVIPLFLLPGGNAPVLAATIAVVSWIVFLVDFTVHQRRLTNYLGTWLGRFDLVVVVLTAPWFLIVPGDTGKFVMLIRLARVARLLMATSGARRLFERLGRVALLAAIVVTVGALVGYRAEHDTNPGFETIGDAFWWAIVTLTTVGYGDIVPETTAGRVDGVMIMLTGVAVLGLLAGSLASFFRLGSSEAGAATADIDPQDPEAVARELAALREEIVRLAGVVAQLTTTPEGPRP